MKKTLVTAGLLAGLLAANTSALDLVVNGQTLSGVDVTAFTFTGTSLNLTTSGSAIVVDGGGDTGGGETDTTPPTLSISASPTALTGAQTSTLTFNFSESVTGFISGDVSVSGGALSNFSGSGSTYTATLTPSGASSITATVGTGAYQDTAGNLNTSVASVSLTYTADQGEDLCNPAPNGVECNYHYSEAELASTSIIDQKISVGKGVVVASRFKVPDNSNMSGEFSVQIPSSNARWMRSWISASPGGSAIASRCQAKSSMILFVNWQTIQQDKRCVLNPNTVYYLNITNDSVESSSISGLPRKLQKTFN